MINEILDLLHKHHNQFCVLEESLEKDWIPFPKIHEILYYRLMKLYWWPKCFQEEMGNLIHETHKEKLDVDMLFDIWFLLTKKRRMALIKWYNHYKNIHLYKDIKAFIYAITKLEKNIKKTCNLK